MERSLPQENFVEYFPGKIILQSNRARGIFHSRIYQVFREQTSGDRVHRPLQKIELECMEQSRSLGAVLLVLWSDST